MSTHPVPWTPSRKAEASKETLVSTLGIEGAICIQQNKPVLSLQLCFPDISLHSTYVSVLCVLDTGLRKTRVLNVFLIFRLAFSFSCAP